MAFQITLVLSQQDATAEGQSIDYLDPNRFPDWIDRYKIQMRCRGFRHSRMSTCYNFVTIDYQENFRFLAATDKPILLLWCEHDVTLPFIESRVVAEIMGAELNPVAQAAHLPHLGQPQIVSPIIVKFFLPKTLESVD